MTDLRKINLAQYTAHTRPGKFEAQRPATEYFWEMACEGEGETIYSPGDEGQVQADLFTIDATEADTFGLPIGNIYMVAEDSQGFVIGTDWPSRQAAEEYFAQWHGIVDAPAETAPLETGAPNLDAMPVNELREFAERVNGATLASGQQMFPDMPIGYLRATCRLSAYAANKAVAMECRLRGDILAAQVYEVICERLYGELPDFARW